MTSTEILRRELRGHLRALAAWCVGIVAYIAVVASIFPSIEGSAGLSELHEQYPEALRELFGIEAGSLSTGAGYLDAELFSLVLPLLLLVLGNGFAGVPILQNLPQALALLTDLLEACLLAIYFSLTWRRLSQGQQRPAINTSV